MRHASRTTLCIVAVVVSVACSLPCWAVPTEPPPTRNDERIHALEVRVERLTAIVEASSSQRAVDVARIEQHIDRSAQSAGQALDAVTSVVTWILGALGAIAALLAILGWSDIRRSIDASVARHVEERVQTQVEALVRPLLRQWDDKFGDQFKRVEALKHHVE